jgi:hypothetical protein
VICQQKMAVQDGFRPGSRRQCFAIPPHTSPRGFNVERFSTTSYRPNYSDFSQLFRLGIAIRRTFIGQGDYAEHEYLREKVSPPEALHDNFYSLKIGAEGGI